MSVESSRYLLIVTGVHTSGKLLVLASASSSQGTSPPRAPFYLVYIAPVKIYFYYRGRVKPFRWAVVGRTASRIPKVSCLVTLRGREECALRCEVPLSGSTWPCCRPFHVTFRPVNRAVRGVCLSGVSLPLPNFGRRLGCVTRSLSCAKYKDITARYYSPQPCRC